MTAGATSWQIMINHLHLPQILSQTKTVAWHCIQLGGPIICVTCLVLSLYVWLSVCLVLCLEPGPYILWSAPLLNNSIISQWLPCIINTAKGDNVRIRQRQLLPRSQCQSEVLFCICVKLQALTCVSVERLISRAIYPSLVQVNEDQTAAADLLSSSTLPAH